MKKKVMCVLNEREVFIRKVYTFLHEEGTSHIFATLFHFLRTKGEENIGVSVSSI